MVNCEPRSDDDIYRSQQSLQFGRSGGKIWDETSSRPKMELFVVIYNVNGLEIDLSVAPSDDQ